MKITVEKQPKSQVKLVIELTEDLTEKFMQKAARQISEMVKIPGFRPGMAPLEILKNHVPAEKIEMHMLDIALPETYSDAIVKEKIQAVSRPKINILSNKPLKYEAVVAVYPEVKITGYEKIKIKKPEIKLEDKEIMEVLTDLRKRQASHKEVDRAAKMGDKVDVDFEGFDEGGALLESTKSKNHPLVLGEGSLVKGFEEELVGLKKDDKKSFKITFPKDYFHKPFQGKKVEFKVEVKKVEEVQLPELNAEFFKKITGMEKTLDQIKDDIRKNLEHEKKHQASMHQENDFLEKIIDLTKVELPEALVEEEIDGILEEFKNDLEGRGISLQQFLEANKKELKDLREQYRKEAEKRLTLRFGLQKLFEQEKLEVNGDEMKAEIEHIIGLYPEKERAKIRQDYKEESYLWRRLENKLKMEKLFDRYLEK
jgi:trigger factor